MSEDVSKKTFEHEDYEYQEQLYKVRFALEDPFIKEIFKNDKDLYDQLVYNQFFATKELYTLNDIQAIDPSVNISLIKKRIRKKRKAALFYCFWRFSFNSTVRGWKGNHVCTAQSFRRYIKGKESKEMLKDIIETGRSYYKVNPSVT